MLYLPVSCPRQCLLLCADRSFVFLFTLPKLRECVESGEGDRCTGHFRCLDLSKGQGSHSDETRHHTMTVFPRRSFDTINSYWRGGWRKDSHNRPHVVSEWSSGGRPTDLGTKSRRFVHAGSRPSVQLHPTTQGTLRERRVLCRSFGTRLVLFVVGRKTRRREVDGVTVQGFFESPLPWRHHESYVTERTFIKESETLLSPWLSRPVSKCLYTNV